MTIEELKKLLDQANHDNKPLYITHQQYDEIIKMFGDGGYNYWPGLKYIWGTEVIVE